MRIVPAAIALLLSVSAALAEMYKWEDANGVVTFKDTPPPASVKPKKTKIYTDSDFAPAPPQQSVPPIRREKWTAARKHQSEAPARERFSGTVELYVTEWCGYCKQAESYMKGKGISYVSYNIEKDRAARQRHKELGGRGVPLIIIGSNRMSGFSPEALEYYLNNSR